jgi:hypothetical protein
VYSGRVVFGAMDEVAFRQPAAEAVAGQMDRLHLSDASLMVSGRIAEQATATPWVPRNARKIDHPDQVREILVLAA